MQFKSSWYLHFMISKPFWSAELHWKGGFVLFILRKKRTGKPPKPFDLIENILTATYNAAIFQKSRVSPRILGMFQKSVLAHAEAGCMWPTRRALPFPVAADPGPGRRLSGLPAPGRSGWTTQFFIWPAWDPVRLFPREAKTFLKFIHHFFTTYQHWANSFVNFTSFQPCNV